MILPMISSKCLRSDGVGLIIAAAIAIAVVGCASAPEAIRMEASTVAEKLGFPNCTVSVPLSPAEVIKMGKELKIYPNPAEDPEWRKMVAIRQPEDQLRRVSCDSKNVSSYVLIRNNEVVFKFDTSFFD